MSMNPRLLRPTSGSDSPASIPGLALWLDASAPDALYTTDAGPATAVSSPLDISGCALWLDADQSDAASFFDAAVGGNAVTAEDAAIARWSDKSGNNRHATQSTLANRPLLKNTAYNGKQCARGDGSRWFVCDGSNIGSANITLFVAYRINEWQTGTAPQNQNQNLYHTDIPVSGLTNFGLRCENGSNLSDVRIGDADSNVAYPLGLTSNSQGVTDIHVARFSGGNLLAKTSGVRRFLNTPLASHVPATFGSRVSVMTGFQEASADRRLRGDVAEFVIYDRGLTDEEVASVEAYLASKWGISGVHAPAVTASQPVGYWRDRSGNGRHATQSTAASRPRVASASVNGRRVAEWHSSTSRMSIASAAVLGSTSSIFAVVKRGPLNWGGGGGGGFGSVLSATSSNAGPQLQVENGSLFLRGGSNLSSFLPSGTVGVTQHAVISGVIDNLATSLYANSALVDSDTAAGAAGTIGAATDIGAYNGLTGGGGPLNAELAEIITYSRALSTAERRKVEVYLARRWGITLAPQVSNAEAQDWISRVYAAGSTVSQPVANAVSAFVDGCQADGIWDAMKSVVLLAGADTLAGALAPLKGTAPTSYNFASGDYSKTSGLKGNGSSTYLDSNRNNDDDPQDNSHNAVYVSVAQSAETVASYLGAGFNSAGDSFLGSDPLSGWLVTRNRTAAGELFNGTSSATGFFGSSRSAAASYSARFSGTTNTVATSSDGVSAADVFLYRRSNGAYADARLAFYSIGEAVDLALLDARVSALMTAIGVS